MTQSLHFRRCLEDGDVDLLMKMWGAWFPHLPQPEDRNGAEIMLHHARTQAESVPLKLRAWSHKWLTERRLPSGLPDHLKPKAERISPVIVDAVGISVVSRSGDTERAKAIQGAMGNAVMEMYADGVTDPERVSKRMAEVREAERVRG